MVKNLKRRAKQLGFEVVELMAEPARSELVEVMAEPIAPATSPPA